ncbi:MAG: hypothetical protein QOI10_4313 [Solirubrobacterales bacterium]|nr:hypothetical protein [Solirubrobacterales bacterium]
MARWFGKVFLGSGAGLSASAITRLTAQWQDDAAAFNRRSLTKTDYVYCWVDGIHLKVRLAQDKVCLLVIIGVRADGRKELVALADGFRESTESWADLLRSCKRRGMSAPVLAVGDGALGFWAALREVSPTPASSAAGSTSRPTYWAPCPARPWSHWPAPVPDSTAASSSNAPRRKEPPNKPRDTPIRR